MRHAVLVSVALVACTADPTGASTSPAETTGTVVDAACATTGNALRFDCSVAVAEAAEVSWSVTDASGEVVRQDETATGVDHTVTLWGLAPEQDYTWTATSTGGTASGIVTTGALPDGLADVSLGVTGSTELDAVLFPSSCGGFVGMVMVDLDGQVRWYEAVETSGGQGPLAGVTGFDWSADDTLVVGVDGERVLEVSAAGEVLRDLSGFDRPLHHDLAVGDDGRIWTLNAQDHDGYVVDGLYVFDEDGALEAEWDLADHVTPSGSGAADQFWSQQFPGASDWSHGNSIELGPDGTALLSLRWLDAVLEVVVDPDTADFGAIDWTLTGAASELSSDLAWTDGGGFDGQHHASWTPEGRIALFDNGTAVSRALVVEVDLEQGTAAEHDAWSMDQQCRVQGAAYPRTGGGMVATCADASEVRAFEAGGGPAAWTLTATCAGGGAGQSALTRALPIAW